MTSLSSDQTREEEEVDSSLDSRIGHRNKNGRGDNNYYSDDSTMTDQDTFDVTEEFDHASSQQQTHTGTEKTGSTSYSQYIFGFFQMPDFSIQKFLYLGSGNFQLYPRLLFGQEPKNLKQHGGG